MDFKGAKGCLDYLRRSYIVQILVLIPLKNSNSENKANKTPHQVGYNEIKSDQYTKKLKQKSWKVYFKHEEVDISLA